MKYKFESKLEASTAYLTDKIRDLLTQGDISTLLKIEKKIESTLSEIASSAGALICPQANTILDGLKKLVEKDSGHSETYPRPMLIGC